MKCCIKQRDSLLPLLLSSFPERIFILISMMISFLKKIIFMIIMMPASSSLVAVDHRGS
jgi:hypothetical protein